MENVSGCVEVFFQVRNPGKFFFSEQKLQEEPDGTRPAGSLAVERAKQRLMQAQEAGRLVDGPWRHFQHLANSLECSEHEGSPTRWFSQEPPNPRKAGRRAAPSWLPPAHLPLGRGSGIWPGPAQASCCSCPVPAGRAVWAARTELGQAGPRWVGGQGRGPPTCNQGKLTGP